MNAIVLELRAVTDACSGSPCAAWIDISRNVSAATKSAEVFVDGSPLHPPIVSFVKTIDAHRITGPGRVIEE